MLVVRSIKKVERCIYRRKSREYNCHMVCCILYESYVKFEFDRSIALYYFLLDGIGDLIGDTKVKRFRAAPVPCSVTNCECP